MKVSWKPGNMLYPLPAVLVSTRGRDGKDNLLTVAWTGTVNTNPPMVYISVRKSRYSYQAIHETGVFAINLTTEELAFATDFCGVRSGRDLDKFEACHLHKEEADEIAVSLLSESPVNIECRVTEEKELGSHVMFLAEVLAVHADSDYVDEKQSFHLEKAHPIIYSHGTYFGLGKKLGTFGYSVMKTKKKKAAEKEGKPVKEARKSEKKIGQSVNPKKKTRKPERRSGKKKGNTRS